MKNMEFNTIIDTVKSFKYLFFSLYFYFNLFVFNYTKILWNLEVSDHWFYLKLEIFFFFFCKYLWIYAKFYLRNKLLNLERKNHIPIVGVTFIHLVRPKFLFELINFLFRPSQLLYIF